MWRLCEKCQIKRDDVSSTTKIPEGMSLNEWFAQLICRAANRPEMVACQ